MRSGAKSVKKIIAWVAIVLVSACASTKEANVANEAGSISDPTPSTPVFQQDDFLGASSGAVDALLGVPALTRKEGDGEYRRYALSSCSLIVILYPDETSEASVTHIEATALKSGEEKPDLETCLAAG